MNCKYHLLGKCNFGNRCWYKHGVPQRKIQFEVPILCCKEFRTDIVLGFGSDSYTYLHYTKDGINFFSNEACTVPITMGWLDNSYKKSIYNARKETYKFYKNFYNMILLIKGLSLPKELCDLIMKNITFEKPKIITIYTKQTL